ncbi:MAG: aspartate kinase [Simkaniaceae bacterium]|nr:aspartate kinase [Simkaniaceae bacterium]
MKFGGAALATVDQIEKAAEIIVKNGPSVVVVSAMGEMTDHLIELAYQVHPEPPPREKDMLISVGERISMSLLAMALAKRGVEAISLTGSQSGIITSTNHSEAEICDVRPIRIREALCQNKIVIVAGFQGVSLDKEITTLGRGGSDTTAVALGAALQATQVNFYKDVPGIYSHDPKDFPESIFHAKLTYNEALEILERSEKKILHPRAINLAAKHALPLHILSFKEKSYPPSGTIIS